MGKILSGMKEKLWLQFAGNNVIIVITTFGQGAFLLIYNGNSSSSPSTATVTYHREAVLCFLYYLY